MSDDASRRSPRGARPSRAVVVGAVALAVALVVGVGAVLAATRGGSHDVAVQASPSPLPDPVLLVDGARATSPGPVPVTWKQPLHLAVDRGTLLQAEVRDPRGTVAGLTVPDGWTATATLVPARTYDVRALVDVGEGRQQELLTTLRTAAPDDVVSPVLLPDGGSYGVGQPLVLHLDRAVTKPVDRAALVAHLQVSATPTVTGTWRFFNSYEVHYHPARYWRPGTVVKARVDLTGLRLAGTGTWGSPAVHTTEFRIGPSVVSTVDLRAHTMRVVRDGVLLRTLPVSGGRDKYPTKGGVHVVLAVVREQLYDSATVGIPTASPDGYYEKLPYSVRISNGGAFVHANPATVASQGRENVSHGCVNLSLADAAWFFSVSHLGDVVDVVNAVVPPVRSDEGMFDWN